MIHALLRDQGMEVFGKTTGSEPKYLLPDGREKSIRRFGPANVREQRNIMILSAFSSARQNSALVLECNAVQEELQHISMRWLKPDITVITNVREDHVQDLGSVKQAAMSFAAAIPEKSALVTSDDKFMDVWEAAANKKSLKTCFVKPHEAGDCVLPENTACVLGVADYLGIDRSQALKAIARHKPDAGAFGIYSWKAGSRSFFFADARAANDIESTDRLVGFAFKTIKPDSGFRRILLLINREDRPDRTWRFLQYIINLHKTLSFDQYIFHGRTPLSSQKTLKREGINYTLLKSMKDLDCILEEISEQRVFIFGMGNYGGPGKRITKWLEAKRQEPEFTLLSENTISKVERQ